MALIEQINLDIKAAMLAREKDRLEALRGIKTALMLALTEKGKDHALTGEEELRILQKLMKQRKEAADIYQSGGRAELAAKEHAEAEVIAGYLPKPLDEASLKREVERIIKETGASGMKDMGKVMGVATRELAGKADGKILSGLVREMLS